MGFGEVQGEGEDAEEASGEGEHGVVVGVDCGAEEGCGGVGGPLVPGGGGRGGDGAVLLGVRGVFAHEEAFFEVASGGGVEFAFEEGFVAGEVVRWWA